MNTGQLNTEIAEAARLVSQQWPGVISEDDAHQEIWLKLLENPGVKSSVEALRVEQRKNLLVQTGHQIASGYRNDYERFSGQIFYGTKDVRGILDSKVLSTDYEKIGTGMTLIEYLDLMEGMQLLREKNTSQAEIISSKWFLGTPIHKDRKSLTRAVDGLARCMNRVHNNREKQHREGPGTRDVISNAKASRINSQNYSGDFDNKGANFDRGKDIA